MDTSYVAVGTVMSMITDSLTCRPQKNPLERDAGAALGAVLLGPHKAPLVPAPIHAVQHERAGCEGATQTQPSLPLACEGQGNSQRHRPSYTVSPAGQRLKRSRPAVEAAQAVGRYKKAPPKIGDSSGAKVTYRISC